MKHVVNFRQKKTRPNKQKTQHTKRKKEKKKKMKHAINFRKQENCLVGAPTQSFIDWGV